MNRRAISILAVLAMLCTMFTFAMPVIAETTELALDFPKYADHANHPDQKEWTIQDAADWKAMMATADAAAAGTEYFKGVTFHLTQNVNFAETEWLPPMGSGRYFSGTIKGHGFGFENLKIYEGNAETDERYNSSEKNSASGMFHQLGNCTFEDFGVNSGFVVRSYGGTRTSVTTFGGLVNGYKPKFTRVWSGMTLRHTNTGIVSALASPAVGEYEENIEVNGFVFDGKITTVKRNSFSLIGSVNTDRQLTGTFKYTNIITDAQMYTIDTTSKKPQLNGADSLEAGAVSAPGEKIATEYYSMVFSSSSTSRVNASNFENLYTVDYPNTIAYLGRTAGTAVRTADPTMMAESALEAAWTINKKPSKKADVVYFTLNKDGKIRPTASADKKIVKVTLSGIKDEVFYLNANTTYNLETTFGKNDQQTFKLGNTTLSELALGSEDVVIEVTTDCEHANAQYVGGENEHTKTCNLCGFDKKIPCSAESDYTVNPINGEDLAKGEKATHSGTCQFCHQTFTLECNVDYVLSTEANQEAYWDYSSCACGRENVEHTNTALVLSGDATGDDKIDLLDAVRILKKSVQSGEVEKERNADVDGDNAIQPLDAFLAIRIWFGNKEAIKQADATAARINAENLFNSKDVTKQSLKMDGTEGDVAGYVVSDPIAVQKGEKLSFGPVRLSAPVIGYFYDAEGNPLQLINHTNVKVEYTFEEGKALVSIDVPADAESVRFQMATEEADQFYLRLNTAITGMDYENRFENTTVENPLKGRTFLTVGDSLCAAANDAYVGNETIGYIKGWARRIRDTFGAKVTNSAKGGSTLSTTAWKSPKGGGEPVHYIFGQLNQHSGVKNFDYILLEGGVNDHRFHNTLSVKDPNNYFAAPVGTIVEDSYDPADFDAETTLAGGMERLIYKAIKDHGDTAALGYIALYRMSTSTSGFDNAAEHLNMAKRICDKWGIAYVDFYNEPIEGFNPAAGVHTSDDCHASAEGYDLMQPRINELCLEMRPVSKEIYDIVQQTELVNTELVG